MTSNELKELNENDFVIYRDGTETMAGGFKINSIFNESVSPMATFNNNPQTGGSSELVGSIFSDLAVPAGLLFIQQKYPETYKYNTTKKDTIPEAIHERLLSLVSPKKRLMHNINTRKKKSKLNKSTRKKR